MTPEGDVKIKAFSTEVAIEVKTPANKYIPGKNTQPKTQVKRGFLKP